MNEPSIPEILSTMKSLMQVDRNNLSLVVESIQGVCRLCHNLRYALAQDYSELSQQCSVLLSSLKMWERQARMLYESYVFLSEAVLDKELSRNLRDRMLFFSRREAREIRNVLSYMQDDFAEYTAELERLVPAFKRA